MQPLAINSSVKDYIALLKPRVISLVVFSGFVGMFIAPGEIHPLAAITAILCLALGAGAAGAINMWYERETDALMKRTASRPIPGGRIEPNAALEFGIFSCFASVFIMAVIVNYTAALLLLFAITFYVFIYTMWLKFRTPQNIVIGGLPGAMPPMIGWAAVTGDISILPVIITLIIFMWTPPHFWSLALYRHEDYKKAGIPMLPVTHGAAETKKQIFYYTLALVAVTLLPYFLGYFAEFYLVVCLVFGGIFIYRSFMLFKNKVDDEEKYALGSFKFSIYYLFAILVIIMVDYAAQ